VRFWAAIVVLVLAAPAAAEPQVTGKVSGTIFDRGGAPIPFVFVVASGPAMADEEVVVSDDRGTYDLRDLPPGVYTVRFATVQFLYAEEIALRRDVLVQIGKTTRLDVHLPPRPVPMPPDPVFGPGIDVDEYTRNIPVCRTFAGVLAGSPLDTVDTPTIVFVDVTPRSRAGQIAVTARVGVGVRRFADEMRCAGVCSGRAPATMDLEAAYAITRHVELTVEGRFGLERELDGRRAIRVSPGVRVFLGDHVFVQPAVSLDVADEFAVHGLEGVAFELGGGFAAHAYVGEGVEVSERLVASLEAGLGLQVHFR